MFAIRLTTLGTLVSILAALAICTDSDSPSSSNSSSLIKVTVLSSNGTDLTSSIPILHSHIPRSPLHQRSYTRPIRNCPPIKGWTARSWCARKVSPQQFRTHCQEAPQAGRPRPRVHDGRGRCTDDEICVGGQSPDWKVPREAYCVSTNNFTPIGQARSSSGQASTGVVTAGFHPALPPLRNVELAVEAVVTGVGNLTSVFATSMVVQAQSFDGVVWKTVDNGTADCLRCANVVLTPFPEAAKRVKVDVVMPEATPVGLLWLASYEY